MPQHASSPENFIFPDPLHILHLEDNPLDHEIVRATLEQSGTRCEFSFVEKKTEFEAALDRGGFDVILADFDLGGYSGAEALVVARARYPETPFVFVSGTIGEEEAVESFKSGATDYVMKSNLSRLVPAVRRSLHEAHERARRREAEAVLQAESKRAEEALRESEQRFREMAESIRDVFWITTPDGEGMLYVSPAYATVWGQPVETLYASPRSWIDAIVPDDRPGVLAALTHLAEGCDYRIEYRITRPDGALRWIEDRGFAVRNTEGRVERTLGVATDITERKELEGRFRQAQKMDAIGQLAGGVAHDFNNLLTVITGHAQLLLDQEQFDPEIVRESLKEIYTAGERATSLTRQLLVFSRKHRPQLRTVDLNEVIDDLGKMMRRLIGEDIAIQLSLTTRRALVNADTGMLEQVLMNLVVNARDAMPRGGRLEIKTEAIELSTEEAERQPGARAGSFVRLSVRDTGTGIAPQILPRIFEPFFTTKDPGKGTGLGLATVFGIVQQHEGWIAVESQVGEGTTFTISLPVATSEAVAAGPREQPAQVSGGKETVLVVEDETAVRDFAVAVLQRYGYRVLQAPSGDDALEVWQRHSTRIALLVTDLVMPGTLNGLDLTAKLLTEKPGLKAICVSGYSGDSLEQSFRPRPGVRILHKPYQPRVLAQAVREILDTSS